MNHEYQIHLLVLLKKIVPLINAWNMEHIQKNVNISWQFKLKVMMLQTLQALGVLLFVCEVSIKISKW